MARIKKKRPGKVKAKKKKIKKPVMPAFEDIGEVGNFRAFKPAIRVRAVRSSPPQRKMNIVLGNLLLFIILFVLSSVLYIASSADFYKTLFFLLSLIFGGLSIAFLIILLVLIFLRILKQ